MYQHSGVTQVELRKSITAKSARTISVKTILGSIREDIREHAEAAGNACTLVGEELVVRMPLTFTRLDGKGPEPGMEDDYFPFREPIGETFAVADAIVQATQLPGSARFVGGVDVVGDEKKVANWLYALAFKRIGSVDTLELEFACHAGEYSADPIEGLRRIGEVALFAPAHVRRIGHCLSLRSRGDAVSQDPAETLVLLENLLWLRLLLDDQVGLKSGACADPAAAALKKDLSLCALRLVPYVFGTAGPGIGDLCDWYSKRFDPTTMVRWIPSLREGPRDTLEWPQGVRVWHLPSPVDYVDAMLAASVYSVPFEVRTNGFRRIDFKPNAEIPSTMVESIQGILAKAEPFATKVLHKWLQCEQIVIESCPSSNAALVDIEIAMHPVWEYHNKNLACSINTDDPALFGSALCEEYVHAGMLAERDGCDGAKFLRDLAEMGRTVGTIQRGLCAAGETPTDTYRKVLSENPA